MIHILIGQSGSGKTTYLKREWLKEEMKVLRNYPVPVTCSGSVVALGLYGIGRREEGTDKLPYNALPKILQAIDQLMTEHYTIIAEGDRVNNARMFNHIIERGYPCELILFLCSLQTSLFRLRAAGSQITERFVKATATKSANNYRIFGKRMTTCRVVMT